MNREDLQRLARLRIADARILLRAGRFEGAYYLAGYSVECALKACIAKQTPRYDFPDKERVLRSHTHNLQQLLDLSNVKADFLADIARNKAFELNWGIAKDWNERARYSLTFSMAQANDLYTAVNGRTNGVLGWLKRRW
jgi:AbiV family abortive infection protein